MGLGKWNGTRHLPITPWEGSWAEKQTFRRGANAAMRGVPYSDNPEKAPAARLSWAQGHNARRATMAIHHDKGLIS